MSLAEHVSQLAAPQDGTTLLLLGTPDWNGRMSGGCVPREVVHLAGASSLKVRIKEDWAIGIILSPKTCTYSRTHPAFFTQVLAHEFSHGRVALADPDLHIYCSFIDNSIKAASGDRVRKWHELPHERAHDAFGNDIATALFGRSQLNAEMQELALVRGDGTRLAEIIKMEPRSDLTGLRGEVRDFALPFAEPLIEAWDKKLLDVEQGARSIVELAPHIREFFGSASQ